MLTVIAPETPDQAYEAESSAWDRLDGRIPGQVGHNPALWTAWLTALRAASRFPQVPTIPSKISPAAPGALRGPARASSIPGD
jgi:hypothetical protein